jgi:hypothetical protein
MKKSDRQKEKKLIGKVDNNIKPLFSSNKEVKQSPSEVQKQHYHNPHEFIICLVNQAVDKHPTSKKKKHKNQHQ